MKAKYRVRLETITPRKKLKKITDFTVDPTKNNRFFVQIDYWNKIVVDVERRRWWEFWK